MLAKPFIKWVGGKSQLLEEIREKYPSKIEKYCEPFVGGGAVLFDILSKFQPKKVLINDINKELINTYSQIKNNCESMISQLSDLQSIYKNHSLEENKGFFYEKRTRYNELKVNGNEAENLEKAVLFIFLNKTCFNGLYRVNSKGLFNVPFNNAKNPLLCDEENLRNCSMLLQNVEMKIGDYKECKSFIDDKTFVYIDPPYRPLTQTAAFTSYSENGFSDKEQIELGNFITEISNKGAKVLASNSDPKNANENDNFFDDLYSHFEIERVSASRMINSNAKKRGAINELLISNIASVFYESNMIKGGVGGGNTRTGLVFEGKVDLATFLSKQPRYKILNGIVYYDNEKVARIFKKHAFYKFLEEIEIDWHKYISKQLLPDDSIYVIINNTLYIIECKHQQVAGSVDEKLQTCDFKKKEYQKLMAPANIKVQYMYLLDNWFRDPKYKDVLDYIISVGCQYYFEYIPLVELGLPVPPELITD